MAEGEHRIDTPSGFNRRDIFKLGGLAVAALAAPVVLTNLNRHEPDAGSMPPWIHADLLVIGSGFAGVFAALEARARASA